MTQLGMCSSMCTILTSLALSSCTHKSEREAQQHEVQRAQVYATLQQAHHPDSLAAAALWGPSNNRPAAFKLAKQASDAAPDRPDLAWLALALCGEVPGCEGGNFMERIERSDPENGIVALWEVEQATREKDPDALERAITKLALSERVDLYWNPLVAKLTKATMQSTDVDVREALTAIAGQAAYFIPALQPVTQACEPHAAEARKEHCRSIAEAMMKGDTYIIEAIGVAIAARVFPANSPERVAALDLRRTSRYHRSEWDPLSFEVGLSEEKSAQHLDLLSRVRTEQELVRQELIRAKKPVVPPADWREEST